MANFIFNNTKGRDVAFIDNVNNDSPVNSGLVVLLLKTAEADEALRDYDDLAALLAGSSVEADFTNYARKVLTDTDGITVNVNDSTNTVSIDIPDPVWASAGGTLDNTTAKLIMGYDSDTTSGTDSNIIPMYAYDFVATTNGNNLTAQVNAAGLISQ